MRVLIPSQFSEVSLMAQSVDHETPVVPPEVVSIRECPPVGETITECNSRLKRIVTKQWECYGIERLYFVADRGRTTSTVA